MKMERKIAFLDEISPQEVHIFGGKAVNTSRLCQGGVRVPIGFALSGDSYLDFLRSLDVTDLVQRLQGTHDLEKILEYSSELEGLAATYELPHDLKREILSTRETFEKRFGAKEFGYAVRSSATIEDGGSISFAGQAESYLCIQDDDSLIESVRRVWASALTPRAVLYLQTMQVPLSQIRMSVMIQEMIPAEASGILFTANVITSNVNQVLVEAVWGLGEPLVSGRVIPDTYVIDRNLLEVVQERLGKMESMLTAGNSCTVERPVPKNLRGRPVLSRKKLHELVKEGLRIEELMGGPQDIEWCLHDGKIVILQSRPITTL